MPAKVLPDPDIRMRRGYERLRAFLSDQMSMSHVYQPLMIRTILSGGGAATRRQIAAAFLAADLSQLRVGREMAATAGWKSTVRSSTGDTPSRCSVT